MITSQYKDCLYYGGIPAYTGKTGGDLGSNTIEENGEFEMITHGLNDYLYTTKTTSRWQFSFTLPILYF